MFNQLIEILETLYYENRNQYFLKNQQNYYFSAIVLRRVMRNMEKISNATFCTDKSWHEIVRLKLAHKITGHSIIKVEVNNIEKPCVLDEAGILLAKELWKQLGFLLRQNIPIENIAIVIDFENTDDSVRVSAFNEFIK